MMVAPWIGKIKFGILLVFLRKSGLVTQLLELFLISSFSLIQNLSNGFGKFRFHNWLHQ
jgi:hypothetical protein